jgi:hypothetical protein
MVGKMDVAYAQYDEDIQKVIGDYDTFGDTVKTAVSDPENGIVAQTKAAADSAATLRTSAETSFSGATTAVDTWQSNYSAKMDEVITKNETVVDSI